VHAKVKDGHDKNETTRGASLRELQRFFKEHDKDEGYADLRRIADEDGTAVWTILKETEVAAQLEKRAGERREEVSGDTATPGLALANRELEAARAEAAAKAEEAEEAEAARKEAEKALGESEVSAACPSPQTQPRAFVSPSLGPLLMRDDLCPYVTVKCRPSWWGSRRKMRSC